MDSYAVSVILTIHTFAPIGWVCCAPTTTSPSVLGGTDGTHNHVHNKQSRDRDHYDKSQTFPVDSKPTDSHADLDFAPRRARLLPSHQQGCIYGNKTYEAGQRFRPSPCEFCRCPRHGGHARCVIQDCMQEPGCTRYHRDPDHCCGQCVERGCRHADGRVFSPGDVVLVMPCETCRCPLDGGLVACDKVLCPSATCERPLRIPGDCCPLCL